MAPVRRSLRDQARGAEHGEQDADQQDLAVQELAEQPAVDRQQPPDLREAGDDVDPDRAARSPARATRPAAAQEPAASRAACDSASRVIGQKRSAVQRRARDVAPVALVVDRHQSWASCPSARRNTSSSVSAPGPQVAHLDAAVARGLEDRLRAVALGQEQPHAVLALAPLRPEVLQVGEHGRRVALEAHVEHLPPRARQLADRAPRARPGPG